MFRHFEFIDMRSKISDLVQRALKANPISNDEPCAASDSLTAVNSTADNPSYSRSLISPHSSC
jgi:hypothetical protein